MLRGCVLVWICIFGFASFKKFLTVFLQLCHPITNIIRKEKYCFCHTRVMRNNSDRSEIFFM